MIGCRSTRTRLHDHLAGALDARQSAQVEAHLRRCADCREEAAFERMLVADLPALAGEPPAVEVRQRVLAAIPDGAATPTRRFNPLPVLVGTGGAYALGLVALVALAVSLGDPRVWAAAGAGAEGAFGGLAGIGQALLVVAAAFGRLALELLDALSRAAAPLAPLARFALGAGVVAMLLTSVLVVGRDLRPRPAAVKGSGS